MADRILTLCTDCAKKFREAYDLTTVLTTGAIRYDIKYECENCGKKVGRYGIDQYIIRPKGSA